MSRKRSIVAISALGMILSLAGVPAIAQAPAGPEGQRGPGAAGSDSQVDKKQAGKQKRSDRMRDTLGSTPEEWVVLQPRIDAVQKLTNEISSVGERGLSTFSPDSKSKERDPSRPRPEGAKQPSPVVEKASDLEKAAKSKDANTADLKFRLAAVREARTRAEAELNKAREDLRALVTVRQEAILVMIGVLK